ncbi:hypothetical protein Salat_2965600 [Sesamum alatum]|uniref:Uncharacterized protein n=1 Tax=Sesamum alatum TaxID=300844 RepID=A0AAE1XIY5_9LAMI|nr:hypothetical protein Salat_2965600 [Sesamum alatum]
MSLLQYDERLFGTANLRRQEEVALERAPSLVMPNSEFPKEVLLMNNEGIQTRIPVEYEWVLVPALCGVIGHKPEHCKAAKKKAKQKTSSRAKQGSPSVSRPQAALDVQGLAQALHTLPPPDLRQSRNLSKRDTFHP